MFRRNVKRWVLFEEEMSYNNKSVYKQVNVLPMSKRCVLDETFLFHKIFYNLIPVNMPDYLSLFSGMTRLRSCHVDRQVFFLGVSIVIFLEEKTIVAGVRLYGGTYKIQTLRRNLKNNDSYGGAGLKL